MAEYDALDARVRSLEIWRGEMGSVKGDIEAHNRRIAEIDKDLNGFNAKWIRMEARMANIESLAKNHEARIAANEESSSWLGNWKQRAQGIISTLACLYVGIELLWPGTVARIAKKIGLAISAGQP